MSLTQQALTSGQPVVIDDIALFMEREQLYGYSPRETVTGPFACFPLSVDSEMQPS